MLEFPNGAHLTFTCSTQLSPHQRVTIVGTRARLEVLVPFNAPNDAAVPDRDRRRQRSARRQRESAGASRWSISTRCRATSSSRAVRGEQALEFPIEDAVLNMRVIDAAFRAGASGQWEVP